MTFKEPSTTIQHLCRTDMKAKLVIFLLTDFIIADEFRCYLCNGMQSSLQVCDEKILKDHCATSAQGADRCGIFSFLNASGIRVYGCVSERFCESPVNFCNSMSAEFGKPEDCKIECCSEELCNYNNSSTSPDDDFEDCDWINAGMSLSVSGFLIEACTMYAVMTMVK